jgi:hypothetical protein
MEIFEYLMVMVAIILGLGVTQTLRGLSKIARGSKSFIAVTIWALTLFYLHIQVWWALWDLTAVETWNQAYFYYVVSIPCALFSATELLLPLGSSSETDWQSHFFSVRKWFFGILVFFVIISILESRILLSIPLIHPYRLFQVVVLSVVVTGLMTKSPRAHVWISATFIISSLAAQALFRLLPGLA